MHTDCTNAQPDKFMENADTFLISTSIKQTDYRPISILMKQTDIQDISALTTFQLTSTKLKFLLITHKRSAYFLSSTRAELGSAQLKLVLTYNLC